MLITFLSARLPLTKTFLSSEGRIISTPYPHVSRFTSVQHEVGSLQELYDKLKYHAERGHCLFSGSLTAPLVDESRAGKTVKEPRQWIVFDFDKVDAVSSADAVEKYLPPECQQVSYVAQQSASMYRPDASKWSGHVFMLLKSPVDEQRVRQWFEWINFNNQALSGQITLSESRMALHWPLDRTASYNSRLIYIAPPRCVGFTPAVKSPFALVKKKLTHLTITDSFVALDSITIRQRINDLRRAVGENEIQYVTRQHNGEEIMLDAELCEVHGIRTSGDHFIRFNLNGGDSFAYFIDLRNPDLIKNFKGEPYLKTKDAAPELFKALQARAPRVVAKAPLEDNTEVLAFYATNQNSRVKVGMHIPTQNKVELHTSTETAAKAWLAEYGIVQKGFLPHISLAYDPASDVQYVSGSPTINQFVPTKYMTDTTKQEKEPTIASVPPVIDKLLRSVLGTPNDEVYSRFVNWLAFIMQRREKSQTAWVLHGRTGTGKGLFVKHVLTPIFGASNIAIVQLGALSNQFNGFLENKLFVLFEESDAKQVENSAELVAKMNHYITDSPISIRKMSTDWYDAPSFANFIFTSNQRVPSIVTADDRRYNIPARQENMLYFTPNELKKLQSEDELFAFAALLRAWPVNVDHARKPIETDAKRDVHEANTPVNALIAEAISAGNLQFFIDRMPSEAEALSDFHNRFSMLPLFKAKMEQYSALADANEASILTDEDLFVLFRTLIPDNRFFQDSKTWRRRHYKALGLDVDKQHRSGKDRLRGVRVEWKPLTDRTVIQERVNAAAEPGRKVVSIGKTKKK